LNQLRTIFLLGVLIAVLVGIGGAPRPGYLYVFAALALIINFGSYFFSDRIVLAMHRAQELGAAQADRSGRTDCRSVVGGSRQGPAAQRPR